MIPNRLKFLKKDATGLALEIDHSRKVETFLRNSVDYRSLSLKKFIIPERGINALINKPVITQKKYRASSSSSYSIVRSILRPANARIYISELLEGFSSNG